MYVHKRVLLGVLCVKSTKISFYEVDIQFLATTCNFVFDLFRSANMKKKTRQFSDYVSFAHSYTCSKICLELFVISTKQNSLC